MDAFPGEYVLPDFWATWCVLCRAQANDLKRILHKYGEEDLVVLGLNNEGLDTTRAFSASRLRKGFFLRKPWNLEGMCFK